MYCGRALIESSSPVLCWGKQLCSEVGNGPEGGCKHDTECYETEWIRIVQPAKTHAPKRVFFLDLGTESAPGKPARIQQAEQLDNLKTVLDLDILVYRMSRAACVSSVHDGDRSGAD